MKRVRREPFFRSLSHSTHSNTFSGTPRLWTLTCTILWRTLLRVGSTISSTDCATSVLCGKSVLSSHTGISLAKFTSSTREEESATWSWRRYTRYAAFSARILNTAKMDQSIVEFLVKEHVLNDSETDKSLLNAKDFLKILRCHWVTDINFFSHERRRVQIATLLLLTAVTASRLRALLRITYEDIELFVLRDKKTGEIALTLQLRLKKTKSRQKRNLDSESSATDKISQVQTSSAR